MDISANFGKIVPLTINLGYFDATLHDDMVSVVMYKIVIKYECFCR